MLNGRRSLIGGRFRTNLRSALERIILTLIRLQRIVNLLLSRAVFTYRLLMRLPDLLQLRRREKAQFPAVTRRSCNDVQGARSRLMIMKCPRARHHLSRSAPQHLLRQQFQNCYNLPIAGIGNRTSFQLRPTCPSDKPLLAFTSSQVFVFDLRFCNQSSALSSSTILAYHVRCPAATSLFLASKGEKGPPHESSGPLPAGDVSRYVPIPWSKNRRQ